MGRTFLFGIALLAGTGLPADLDAREIQSSPPDRTREVITVARFLDDLRGGQVAEKFRAALRVYEYPASPRTFNDLEEYATFCPLKSITLPFPTKQIGPVLVHWKCDAEDTSRSVGFFFENGRLAATSMGLDRVPRVPQIRTQRTPTP
jgi:hypothetical protein